MYADTLVRADTYAVIYTSTEYLDWQVLRLYKRVPSVMKEYKLTTFPNIY